MFTVRRAYAKGRLKDFAKTAGSRRAVPLRARVVEALEQLPGKRRGILFPAPEGGRIDINNWRNRVWTPALAAAGVKHRRIYDLRHTYATWSLAAGHRHLHAGPADGHEREDDRPHLRPSGGRRGRLRARAAGRVRRRSATAWTLFGRGGRAEMPRSDGPRNDESPAVAGLLRGTGATGLEPATSGVTGRRSNQLSYAPRARGEE